MMAHYSQLLFVLIKELAINKNASILTDFQFQTAFVDTVFVVLSPLNGAQTDDHDMLKIPVIIQMHSPITKLQCIQNTLALWTCFGPMTSHHASARRFPLAAHRRVN